MTPEEKREKMWLALAIGIVAALSTYIMALIEDYVKNEVD